MPFRERVKRAFGRTPSSSSSSDLSKTTSHKSSVFYQPGEQMPRPKYRQPVDKKHTERLESFNFSFAGEGRRKSVTSTYSPMGSRWPSRQNSFEGSLGGFAYGRRQPPMGWTVEGSDGSSVDSSDKSSSQHVENVSDSVSESVSDTASRPALSVTGVAPDHKPFSEEDLHQALGRSTSKNQPSVV